MMPKKERCTPKEAFEFISSACPLFRSASFDIFARHTRDTVECLSYAPGELISSPTPDGDGGGIGVIHSGSAAVYSGDDSRRVLLRFLTAGGIYGVSSLFCAAPPTRIVASAECRVLKLSRDSFYGMLHEDAALLDAYLEFMSDRILFLNRKISCLSGGSAERRLAMHLLTLAESSGVPSDDGGRDLTLPCSITELARLLDIGRASLYRAFDALEAAGGAYRKDGYRVRVYPAALEAAFFPEA